jgi:phosphoglycolate phosphatase-like HAD superfamily hydrolase
MKKKTWIFDCDGVLLDSNRVKTDAFRALGERYGDDVGAALVRLHLEHGGVSRFLKIRHLHEVILGRHDDAAIVADLEHYAVLVEAGLKACAVTVGARELLRALPGTASCFVVSGGLETEVDATLVDHGLRAFFTGVYGSPRTKSEIFQDLKDRGLLEDAVFFGDARYDAEVAAAYGVEFVYVARYSDWPEGRVRYRDAVIETLADILPRMSAHV